MSEVIIESLATEVIVFASRLANKSGNGRNAWPDRARRLIEDEFASPLSLAGIASAVGVHPVHLARQFRASQGCHGWRIHPARACRIRASRAGDDRQTGRRDRVFGPASPTTVS